MRFLIGSQIWFVLLLLQRAQKLGFELSLSLFEFRNHRFQKQTFDFQYNNSDNLWVSFDRTIARPPRTLTVLHLVQHIVPNENLLVWNLKEGWEPLCNFLNKPIPKGKFQWEKYSVWFEVQIFEIFEVPVPHDNKTGDAEFMKNYIFKNQFWKKVNVNPSVSPSPGSFLTIQFVLISKCSGRAIIHDQYWYWCD